MSKTEKPKKAAPKKAAKNEKQTFELAKIDVSKLPEFQGWKTKLLKIDKDNPVITEIEDFKTYEEAKKRRHNRRLGRYEVQNSDKAIAAEISKLRKQAGALAEELIEIVKPGEDAQDEVIKVYEDRKAREAEEKRLEEEARQNEIKTEINNIFDGFSDRLEISKFEDLEGLNRIFKELEEMDREPFEELEWLYLDQLDAARLQLQKTEARLEKEEADRKERARLQKYNNRLKELTPVFDFGPSVNLETLAEMNDTKFEELLHTKRQSKKFFEEAEEKREAEEKARRDAEAEKQKAQEKELQELREAKAKADAEKLEARVNVLKNLGFKDAPSYNGGAYWHPQININVAAQDLIKKTEAELQEAVNLWTDQIRKADEKAAAEEAARLKAEKEAKAKAEKEEAARKAAEEKRLKALQPVKDQLKAWASSLEFSEEIPEMKSDEARRLAEWFKETVKNLKADFINDVNDLK